MCEQNIFQYIHILVYAHARTRTHAQYMRTYMCDMGNVNVHIAHMSTHVLRMRERARMRIN